MGWFQASAALAPDLIERHGRWRAAHTALVEGQRRLSWAEFSHQTAQVAHGLRAAGLDSGDRIAVLMGNSLELAVVLFGILRAGCVAVPLNVTISDAAVGAMIDDADARALIASDRHCLRIEALDLPRVRNAFRLAHESDECGWPKLNEWRAAQGSDLEGMLVEPEGECNIIYSSGTTGVPKGIVHTQRCRATWGAEMSTVLRYRSDSVALCSLGLYSNISWLTLLAALHVGATVVIMRAFDPAAALELMRREKVTHVNFVPLQLEQLLALPDARARRPETLDTVMVCGSPVRLDVKRAFPEHFGCDLIELYGLTEGFCTILAPEDFASHTASVGKPFLGGDMRILGDDDRELGPGSTGEIVGRGPLLMAGYHNREEASREATWTDRQGRRWLRTGDLGYIDEEGFLFIVDRKKDMILSGGQNIFPADIEQVMRQHPGIAEVAVIGARSRKWGETPVAVVVPRSRMAADCSEMMAWTNARVGKQQRIADVVLRDALPRNPNGKVLKRELRSELAAREY